MRMRVECHERRPDHFNLNAVPYQPCVANILFKEERVSRPCEWRSCHREEKTPPQRGGGRFAEAGRWTASSPLPSRERTHPCFRFRAPISLSGKAHLAGVPWVEVRTSGDVPDDLEALADALRERDIDGFVSGALRSDYQKSRLERMAEGLGLVSWTPLWHQSGHAHLKEMIEHGFEIMITGVSAEGLNEAWLGRVLTEASFDELAALAAKHRFHVEGEGGEYETLVLKGLTCNGDSPLRAPCTGTGFAAITTFIEWLLERATHTRQRFHPTPRHGSWGRTWLRASSAENAAEIVGVRLQTSISSSPFASAVKDASSALRGLRHVLHRGQRVQSSPSRP